MEYPVDVKITNPNSQSRLLALLSIPFFLARGLLLIPHMIIVSVLSVVAFLVAWLMMFVILFTGKNSGGMHDFVTGTLRWNTRVNAYLMGLTDKYPPFRLEP